jgi:hypothetical protein
LCKDEIRELDFDDLTTSAAETIGPNPTANTVTIASIFCTKLHLPTFFCSVVHIAFFRL